MDHLKTLTEERILAENAIRKDIISIREQCSNVKIISLDSFKIPPLHLAIQKFLCVLGQSSSHSICLFSLLRIRISSKLSKMV